MSEEGSDKLLLRGVLANHLETCTSIKCKCLQTAESLDKVTMFRATVNPTTKEEIKDDSEILKKNSTLLDYQRSNTLCKGDEDLEGRNSSSVKKVIIVENLEDKKPEQEVSPVSSPLGKKPSLNKRRMTSVNLELKWQQQEEEKEAHVEAAAKPTLSGGLMEFFGKHQLIGKRVPTKQEGISALSQTTP